MDFHQLAKQNFAIIGQCDTLDASFNIITSFDAANYFYMLPEKFMTFYQKFLLADRSPLYGKLQLYHNYVFESGIRFHCHNMLKIQEFAKNDREENYIKNEKYLLTMDDVYGTFYILIVGYCVGLVALLIEIFDHRFIRSFCLRRKVRRNQVKRSKVCAFKDCLP